MDPSAKLETMDPRPISSPSIPPNVPPPRHYPDPDPDSNPKSDPDPMVAASAPGAAPAMGFRAGPEPQMPFYPGNNFEMPHTTTRIMTPLAQAHFIDIGVVRSNCQHNLQQLIHMRHHRQRFGENTSAVDLEWRIRNHTTMLLGELRSLQAEVRLMAKAARNHRWRTWILGGFLTAFIPAVRKLFRRGFDDESKTSSNDTEYAFRKSKDLLSRMRNGVLGGKTYLAGVAFFVFAVMFVFQNEVTYRVARTVHRRIKKLCNKIEYDDPNIGDWDLDLLEGWRWRVILW